MFVATWSVRLRSLFWCLKFWLQSWIDQEARLWRKFQPLEGRQEELESRVWRLVKEILPRTVSYFTRWKEILKGSLSGIVTDGIKSARLYSLSRVSLRLKVTIGSGCVGAGWKFLFITVIRLLWFLPWLSWWSPAASANSWMIFLWQVVRLEGNVSCLSPDSTKATICLFSVAFTFSLALGRPLSVSFLFRTSFKLARLALGRLTSLCPWSSCLWLTWPPGSSRLVGFWWCRGAAGLDCWWLAGRPSFARIAYC